MISEFFAGVGLLGRGARVILRRPRLFLLGALPAVLTTILFLALLITLLVRIDEIVGWLTPFADGWAAGWATTIRILIGVAIVAGSILLMVISFSVLTLAIGAPLYDKISEAVDEAEGAPPPQPEQTLGSEVARAVRQAIGVILLSLGFALLMIPVGTIPVIGQVAGAILSAIFGGWILALELIGSACERRGIFTLGERRALLRTQRAKVLGLGIPTFLLLAVPVLAIIVFPIATAAGTLLARDLTADSRPTPPDPTTNAAV
ncbi:EI24 domain-containing protein [Microlunatus speluncae]|uniref:EI24 domain-containing protein n=1 Tax=Microlunatus speluncae TaxID=2594267 RepID=UPI0012661366|nr:EI24 domain-containing protein [Microlunatus speluncae]